MDWSKRCREDRWTGEKVPRKIVGLEEKAREHSWTGGKVRRKIVGLGEKVQRR